MVVDDVVFSLCMSVRALKLDCIAGCWSAKSWEHLLPQLSSAVLDLHGAVRSVFAQWKAQVFM
jgi:hypothetical protein